METKKPRSRSSAKKSAAKKTTKKTTSRRPAAGSKAKSARKGSNGIEVVTEGNMVRVEREIGGRLLTLETGRMAKQADGAIVASYGETIVLATAQSSKARDDIDFFPLTVDYREKYAAGGRFPGGFFKREGRPTNKEVLACRIIDRSIRPLFPDGFKKEVQVLSQVLSSDLEVEGDILAAVGSFAALAISSIPHQQHLGAVRIGMVDGKFVVNPGWSVVKSDACTLNLTMAGHKDAVVMVEAGADEATEETMLEAFNLGHQVCIEIAELIDELVQHAGKPKVEFTPPEKDEKLEKAIEKKFGKALRAAVVAKGNKHERAAIKSEVMTELKEAFPAPEDLAGKEASKYLKDVGNFARSIADQGERDTILKGKRSDGRDWSSIRPITIEVGVLPRVHGSVLFTRGETQALCIATLGTVDDQQNRDGIYPEDPQSFMLHYNFPPFCVGEVRRMLGVGRREIGHGTLAERSIAPLLPKHESFPYTMRVTSEILESNGSSSMASVCGGTLALMDAGVPIRQPVAGIAMGLVVEGKKVAILSDILGSEDHCGDMDFKVAGTGKGITALQMDIKCEGLSQQVLEEALEQARQGRLHILREMLKVLRQPRKEVSPNAPRLVTLMVPVDKIGFIIGPSGKNIRGMQTEYAVKISIEDSGQVTIGGLDSKKVEACAAYIRDMTAEVEPGTVYTGKVTSIKDFGAFIEILPGQEGLCHISELSNTFISSVMDVVRIGDEVEVKVIAIDDFGKIKLSRKAIMPEAEGDGDNDRGSQRGGGGGRGRSRDVFDDDEGEEENDLDDGVEEVELEDVAFGDDEDGEEELAVAEVGRPAQRESRSGGGDRGRGRDDSRGRDRGPRGDDRGPRGDDRGPRSQDRGPRGDDRGPRSQDRGPRGDDRGPRSQDRGPRGDDRGPRSQDRGPRGDDRGPRSQDRGPRGDDRGPRSEGRGPDRGYDRGPRRDERPEGRSSEGHRGPRGDDRGPRGESRGPREERAPRREVRGDDRGPRRETGGSDRGPSRGGRSRGPRRD